MALSLTQAIQDQIDDQDVKPAFTFKISETDYSSYLMSWEVNVDKSFGSMSGTFILNNDDGIFGSGGSAEVSVGDVIEFIEEYEDDVTEFGRFYGKVEQRSIGKRMSDRIITLNCLDYISVLQHWDIDLEVEGTKVEVTDETLTPNYLPAPNATLAQLFDFANDSIVDNPRPIIMIRDTYNTTDDPQYDGFEIYYDVGQLKLGSPINAQYNYDVIARSYYYYTKGVYAEDILEEILTEEDGYGNYLFGASSAQDVINNHLTTTYGVEEGSLTDTMIPNSTSTTITIETTLASGVTAGATSIALTSGSGFPSSGSGTLNGDAFTWSSKSGANTLAGIPSTGSNSLKAHNAGDYVEYEASYAAGRVWYLDYSNITSTLTSSDFTVPGATVDYVDHRYGRIILDAAISIAVTVTCDSDYTFKTLQASAIELNRISFKPRELDNRFEAITKLRKYLAPNYIVRTQGDKKIWSSYLSQKTTADYDLELVQGLNYMEDEDLYTRVKFFAKNKGPTNIMFNDGVDFVTTGETYKSLASQVDLTYDSTLDEPNYYVYKTIISNAGYIDLEEIKPVVYINNVPIDDRLHNMVSQPVSIEIKTRTTTKTGCHGISKESYTKIHTYYYYKVYFPHMNIEPSEPIYLYDINGVVQITISANDLNMDYARGIWNVSGDNQNSIVETLSTSTYWVFYSTHQLEIDYDNVYFRISRDLLPDPNRASVSATFEYWSVMTDVREIASLIDGRWDTQVQTEFFAEPPSGYNYAIIDLGATYTVQAIDMIAGFFRPDDIRKFDIDMTFSLYYSTNGTDYYVISDETHNVRMSGGSSESFEEDDLGTDFQARYIKIVLENVEKIDFRNGIWVVAFTEMSAYDDIIINSEATLISTTTLAQNATTGDTIVYLTDNSGFTEPDSGETSTAYISTQAFTYTGIDSGNILTGCTIDSGVSGTTGDRVSQTLETDTTVYDDDGLLPQLGDRLYKEIKISDDMLYTQAQLDDLAKDYLQEFYKNHTKVSTNVLYAPYLKLGQTVNLTDSYNDISNVKYFIESIRDRNGYYELILARYP